MKFKVGDRVRFTELDDNIGEKLGLNWEIKDLLKLFEPKKITLKAFFESNTKMAIHCKTQEQAETFRKKSHELERRWYGGLSYKDYDFWEAHKKNTCYSNGGTCGDFRYFEKMGYQVINFDDIDWSTIREE